MDKNTNLILIEKIDSEKDLGVIADNNLKFTSEHIRIAYRNIWVIFRTFTYLDKEMTENTV